MPVEVFDSVGLAESIDLAFNPLLVSLSDALTVSEFLRAEVAGPPTNLIYVETWSQPQIYVETFSDMRIHADTET